MNRKTVAFLLSMIFFVPFAFTGCGNSNIFSFGHTAGSSNTVSSLQADANAALQNGDYQNALKYYQQILQSDPANSEALYGYSSADLANAGLDLPSLIANLIKQQTSAPSKLSPALVKIARGSSSNAGSMLPDIIKQRAATLGPVVNDILENYLKKIIQGKGDGVIAPDNPDLNINIAFCLILRAAITAYDGGVDFTDNYQSIGDSPVLIPAGHDIISAYHRLLVVEKALNLSSNSAIVKINEDIRRLYESLPAHIRASGLDPDYDYFLNS